MKKNTVIILVGHSSFVNISKQFLAPGGLSDECVQVSVMYTWGLQGAGSEAPKAQAWEAQHFLN